jgi:uncharacterized protein (TIGR02996 family)
MFTVIVTKPDGTRTGYEFDRSEVTIGRSMLNELPLSSGSIARRHARIHVIDGELVIDDLGSTNGTYLNGQRITSPVAITSDDTILMGDLTLTIRGGEEGSESVSGGKKEQLDEIERRLLVDIANHFHDPAPRYVYSDYLLERDEPRGELIALQLARWGDDTAAPSRREQQLIESFWRRFWQLPQHVRGQSPGELTKRMNGGFLAVPIVVDGRNTNQTELLRWSPRLVVASSEQPRFYAPFDVLRGSMPLMDRVVAINSIVHPMQQNDVHIHRKALRYIRDAATRTNPRESLPTPKEWGIGRAEGVGSVLLTSWVDGVSLGSLAQSRRPAPFVARFGQMLFRWIERLQALCERHIENPTYVTRSLFADACPLFSGVEHVPSVRDRRRAAARVALFDA